MSVFTFYTIALESLVSLRGKDRIMFVKVEFNSILNGDYIRMNLVSGYDHSNIGVPSVDIHRSVYDSRPVDYFEFVAWAFDFFGLVPSGLEF